MIEEEETNEEASEEKQFFDEEKQSFDEDQSFEFCYDPWIEDGELGSTAQPLNESEVLTEVPNDSESLTESSLQSKSKKQ